MTTSSKRTKVTPEPVAPDALIPEPNKVIGEPEVQVVIVHPSPIPVGLIAVAPGDTVTTTPDLAARLIAAGYAAPTDDLGGL